MPSRTSYFNRTLYRKLLSRFWPLWAGVAVLASLVPLVTLMELTNPYTSGYAQESIDRLFYGILLSAGPAFMMGYAIITAMAVWGYLYAARSVSLMHTLPITRTNLFVTGCTAGFTILLLPMAIAGFLLVLVLLPFGLVPWAAVGHCALGLPLLALCFFGFATLCAMVTGHMLALPVFYFIGSFIAPLVDVLLSTFASTFLFGVEAGPSGAVDWLSPIIYIYSHTGYQRLWQEDAQLWTGRMEGMGVLAAYGLAGLVLLALALVFYLRRPSESAGDVVSLPILRPIFKLGVGVMASVTFGQVLYAILTISSSGNSLFRMGLCMALAGTAGFWIADMLVQKSLRVWRTTAAGAAIMAALSLLVCLGVRTDVLGIERRVPDREDIAQVTLSGSIVRYQSSTLHAGPDDAYLDQVLAIHRAILNSKAAILAETEREGFGGYYTGMVVANQEGGGVRFHSLTLQYRLKDGSVLTRRYNIPITQALLDTPDSYAAGLNNLLNQPEIRLKRLYYGRGYDVYYASVWCDTVTLYQHSEDGGDYEVHSLELDAPEARRLYQAVIEDAKAGRWGAVDLLEAGDTAKTDWLTINLELQRAGQGDPDLRDYISLYIIYTPAMTATAQALLDAGLPAEALTPPADAPLGGGETVVA